MDRRRRSAGDLGPDGTGAADPRRRVRRVPLGVHDRPPAGRPDRQARRHTRSAAARIRRGHGPAVRLRRSDPGGHGRGRVAGTDRPPARFRRGLVVRRRGLRPVPNGPPRATRRRTHRGRRRWRAPRDGNRGRRTIRRPRGERRRGADGRSDGDRRADRRHAVVTGGVAHRRRPRSGDPGQDRVGRSCRARATVSWTLPQPDCCPATNSCGTAPRSPAPTSPRPSPTPTP